MSTTTFTLPEIVTALDEGVGMAVAETPLTLTEQRFTLPMAATLTRLDNPTALWEDVSFQHAIVCAQVEEKYALPVPDDDGRTWTREQVADAVNWAVDQAAGTRRPGACADDIDNFVVNAVLTLLDDPGAEFEDVVVECYGERPGRVSRWLRDAA
ncbi:hypothetical protein ACWDXD_24835 [Streptomyces sp. NPDC003314]